MHFRWLFQCMWCPAIGRCSDGMDRLRQTWLKRRCEQFHHKKGDKECSVKIADTSGLLGKDGHGRRIVTDGKSHDGSDGSFHHHDYSTLDSNSVHGGHHTQGKLKATSEFTHIP